MVLGVAAVIVYLEKRPKPVRVERRLAGREQDVSRDGRVQFAPTLALDPADARLLLAGSSDELSDTRVYASSDAGEHWSSEPGPPPRRANCQLDRPAVAFAGVGRELYAFTASPFCDPYTPKLQVAWRVGASGAWTVVPVAPVAGYARDEHLTLAARRSRAYIAWTRRPRRYEDRTIALLARSDDAGSSWSPPVRLPLTGVFGLELAVAPGGDVYVAAATGLPASIFLLRSTDGGRTFTSRRVAKLSPAVDPSCGGVPLTAQARACAQALTDLVATGARVFLSWGDVETNGTGAVRLASLTDALQPVLRSTRIGPPDAKPSDQFDPSIAYDAATATLWACYEDTFGDPYRRLAWPTCTLSRDGGRTWAAPVRVAASASDENETAANSNGYGSTALAAAGGIAHPMWTDTRDILRVGEEIYASRLQASSLR